MRYCLKTTGTTLRAAMRQKAVPVILCVVTGRPGPGSAFRPPGRERRSNCQAGRCGWQGFRRQWSAGPGGHRQGYKVPGRCEAPGMSANPTITGNLLIHTFHCRLKSHSWKRFWDYDTFLV